MKELIKPLSRGMTWSALPVKAASDCCVEQTITRGQGRAARKLLQ